MSTRSPVIRAIATLVAAAATLASGVAAAGLQVPPVASLPATPSKPYLWFDGATDAGVAALKARLANGRVANLYAGVKSWVNGRLGSVTGGDDDTRARLAKSAGLLFAAGETPPANSGWASYRDVASAALRAIGTRQAVDSLAELLAAPADAINILQDSSRLQSMAEAYDLIRGGGATAEADAAMRGIIATWADALAADWNVAGALGVTGHRDNWAIKAGAALMTAALAMPDHARADTWRATAMTFVNESLAVVASSNGWFGESVWYLNYSLANLWPAALQVKRATGVDWPAALEPFVTASLAWRQPDGRAPPFEEGIANTFPWDVMAGAYPTLAPQMLWAWDHSPKNDENFENQQAHDVTRCLVLDLTSTATEPSRPVTRWLGDTANLAALRTGWDAQALQVTMMTARDYSTSELNTTRHNMRNPLDLVIHGGGALVVPTASGGPTVTTSSDRATFLAVGAKNIPLVSKSAPFVTSSTTLAFGDRLDSEDVAAGPNHFLDLARTTLTDAYAANTSVSRAVALVDRSYVVVLDRFRLDFQREVDLSWRGRGQRTARTDSATLQSHAWAGVPNKVPRLQLDVVGTGTLSTESNASAYADSWNHEETIDGVLVGATAKDQALISVFQIGDGARAVAAAGSASVAAATVTSGTTVDTILANPGDGSVSAGGVTTDGVAALARSVGGVLQSFALVQGKALELGPGRSVKSSGPVTLSATMMTAPGASGLVVELSADRATTIELVMEGLPGIDANEVYEATLAGVSLGNIPQSGTKLTLAALGTGTLVVAPARCRAGSGEDPDGDRTCGTADVCPSVYDNQTDSDHDGVGDACECLDMDTRCPQPTACALVQCRASDGLCSFVAIGGATGCDDHSACTTGDHCAGVECVGTAVGCDDGNACTDDACDPAVGCTHVARAGVACDDLDPCTTGETCGADAACGGGAEVVCDDGDPCTTEACVSGKGCLATGTTSASCDDHDRCTTGDQCQAGQCAGLGSTSCDDGNPCTSDGCDPQLGCTHAALDALCDDHNDCTGGDRCVDGACHGEGLDCDDGDPCTVDVCVIGMGCGHKPPAPDAPCDDGDPCTDGDRCGADGCHGVAAVCDDGDPCTTDYCDGALGCQASPSDDPACVDPIEPGPESVEVVEAAEPGDSDVVDEDVVGVEVEEPAPEPGPELVEPMDPIPDPGPEPTAEASPESTEGVDAGATSDAGGDVLAFSDNGSQTLNGGHEDDGCATGGDLPLGLALPLALAAVGLIRASSRRREA